MAQSQQEHDDTTAESVSIEMETETSSASTAHEFELPQVCAHCSMALSADQNSYIASYDLKGIPNLSVLQGLLLVFKARQPHELFAKEAQEVKLCCVCSDKFQTLLKLYLDFIQTAAEDSFIQKLLRRNVPNNDEVESPVKVECLLETDVEDDESGQEDNPFEGMSSCIVPIRRSQRTRNSSRAKNKAADDDPFAQDAEVDDSAPETTEPYEFDIPCTKMNNEEPEGRRTSRRKQDLRNFKYKEDQDNKKVKKSAGRPRKERKKETEGFLAFHCDNCGEKFNTPLMLRRHMGKHNGSRPFSCDECDACFTVQKQLTNHKKDLHPADPSKKRFRGLKRKRPLQQQMILAADAELLRTEQYKCEDCVHGSVWFPTLKDWILHQERVHGEVMGYGQVELMDTVLPSDGLLRPCPHCGKKYKGNFRLLEHIKYIHLHLSEFQCHLCHKVLMSKQSLIHHTNIIHGNQQKMFLCSLCGSSFNSKGGLEVHEKTHRDVNDEGKQFGCEMCGKKYERRHRLRMHMASAHSEARNFVCDICGNTFKLSTHLNQHKKYIHEKKGVVDQFCSICGKGYAFKDDLKNHLISTHKLDKEQARVEAKMRPPSIFRVLPNGDRVYKEKPNLKPKTICHICNRSYVRRKQLYLHLISIHNHTEEESQRLTGFESKYLHHPRNGGGQKVFHESDMGGVNLTSL